MKLRVSIGVLNAMMDSEKPSRPECRVFSRRFRSAVSRGHLLGQLIFHFAVAAVALSAHTNAVSKFHGTSLVIHSSSFPFSP